MTTSQLPIPEELWGDCSVPIGWDSTNKSIWYLWLKNIAALIIFANQKVIDRIYITILNTIDKAKSGELSAKEAVKIISPQALISPEEWEEINNNAQKQGRIIGQLFYGGSEDRNIPDSSQ
jgi:hypothetical protein